jgi:adenylate cyclase
MLVGQPVRCIPYIQKVLSLTPRETIAYAQLGKCHLLLGQVDEAMPLLRNAEATNPGVWYVHLKLAGALGLKGEIDQARAETAEMVRLKPEINSVARVRGFVWYRNPQFQVLHDRTVIQGLRNAGFPEELAAQP